MKSGYVVFARKYRPMTFDDVVGQEGVSVTLKNALSSKRLAHAYLFTGPRGVGKTTMARILAKALNCADGSGPAPCLKCASCAEVASSSALDVREMDAASHTGVDNIREAIIETVALSPARDRYKVFIIDEAHMLSTQAFNALLKTLEEPPAHVVFILATTEAAKIPITIVSRCQRFRFRPILPETMVSHLKELARREKIEVDSEALEMLAQSAGGALRDAISLLDQAHTFSERRLTVEDVRGMLGFLPAELVLGAGKAILQKDAPALARWLKDFYEQGHDPALFLRDLREAFEAVYLAKLGVSPMPKAWGELASSWESSGMGFLVRRVNRALEELRVSDSPRLSMELSLLGSLEAAGNLSEWVSRLEELERRLDSGEEPPARPPAGPARSTVSGAAPAVNPVAAPARKPLAAPAAGGEGVKGRLLAALADKPSLCSTLAGCVLKRAAAGGWVLVFSREYDLRSAERSKASIEAILATEEGGMRPVSFELGAIEAPGVEEIVDAGIPAPPAVQAAGPAWRDITEPEEGASGGSLGKAEKILGGKLKFVKRKAE